MGKITDKLHFIQDKTELFKRGIISRRGPRDNMTDQETDIILIHIPSKTSRRFHGTFCDCEYIQEMYDFIMEHEETTAFTKEDLFNFVTASICDFY